MTKTKLTNIRKNCMGTLSFMARFNGMRKEQEFIVYPIKETDDASKILIQSDTRIGYINLNNGIVEITPPRSGGSYSVHLIFRKHIDTINSEELAGLKFRLFQTADKMAGSNGMNIFTDNSGVEKVSIFQEVK